MIQKEYNKTVKTEFDTVSEALDRLADASTDDGLQYEGDIVAVLNSNGVAEWVVFDNDNGLESDGPDYGNTGTYRATVDRYNLKVTVTYTGTYNEDSALRAAVIALEDAGYELEQWVRTPGQPIQAVVTNANGGGTTFTVEAQARV